MVREPVSKSFPACGRGLFFAFAEEVPGTPLVAMGRIVINSFSLKFGFAAETEPSKEQLAVVLVLIEAGKI
jgi:hypothetical protein